MIMTTALALGESLALERESGVGTLIIIHHLHLNYIQNKRKIKIEKIIHHDTFDHWVSLVVQIKKQKQKNNNNNGVVLQTVVFWSCCHRRREERGRTGWW